MKKLIMLELLHWQIKAIPDLKKLFKGLFS